MTWRDADLYRRAATYVDRILKGEASLEPLRSGLEAPVECRGFPLRALNSIFEVAR